MNLAKISIAVITARNEVGGKVIFSQASVILSTRGGVPGQVPPPPGTRYTPQDQVHPPGPGTPPGTRYAPPGTRYTPRTKYTPPGQGTLWDQVPPWHKVHPPLGAVHAGEKFSFTPLGCTQRG